MILILKQTSTRNFDFIESDPMILISLRSGRPIAENIYEINLKYGYKEKLDVYELTQNNLVDRISICKSQQNRYITKSDG